MNTPSSKTLTLGDRRPNRKADTKPTPVKAAKAAGYYSSSDEQRKSNKVDLPPLPLIEAWLWMIGNRDSEQIRKDGRARILNHFDSVEEAAQALTIGKENTVRLSSLQKKPQTEAVTTPPPALVKTWMWMMTNRDSAQIRDDGRNKLLAAFGGINEAVKFIEAMNKDGETKS